MRKLDKFTAMLAVGAVALTGCAASDPLAEDGGTGDVSHFNETFHKGVRQIINVWQVEQNHADSPYTFERETWREEDTLTHNGRGTPVKYTGMTWSGFRPSDDRCIHHYLVPSNMFAVVVSGYLEEIYSAVKQDGALLSQIATLKKEKSKQVLNHMLSLKISKVKMSMLMK